jgi:hypothetical protein
LWSVFCSNFELYPMNSYNGTFLFGPFIHIS